MSRRWDEEHPSLFERDDVGPRSMLTGKRLNVAEVGTDGACVPASASARSVGTASSATKAGGSSAPGLSEAASVGDALSPRPPAVPAGEALKQEGMDRVLNVVDVTWAGNAEAFVRHLAQIGVEFTADDVAEKIGLPERRNAVGALLSRMARNGVLEHAGYTASTRPERHAGLIRVWRGAR